jgi:asparagine synthase (glutamine-hydrolysing)
MCGISGIINLDKSRALESQISIMNQVIQHRGPDSSQYYLYENLVLGHRRLSIIDLTEEGNQPMHYKNKYTIVFNGEIYNYIEIKNELILNHYTFESSSDTEVILCAYDFWGEECVSRFNGMWSFSILDKEKNILFISRDRFGVKPFYYSKYNSQFIFGSEIKQILEITNFRKVNYNILMDYLVWGFTDHTNNTFFEGIFKLEPSHNLIYNLETNEYNIKQYFDIEKTNYSSKTNEEVLSLYKEILYNAVDLRLRSDVKVGTCLSGGLDSSSIAAIASKINNQRNQSSFFAIHAKSSEKSSDESEFAIQVKNHCNLEMTIIKPSIEDFTNNIDEVIYTQEEPFGGLSIFMQYFVMQETRNKKCVVLLDGQGGDECLLGYERYYPAIFLEQRNINGFKEFIKGVRNSKISFLKMIGFSFYFPIFQIRCFSLLKKANFIKSEYLKKADAQHLKTNSLNYFNLFNLQKQEIYSTQLQALLRYEDKNSMRHSIEARLPFLDYRLLQLSLSIPFWYKIKDGWTKFILRKSVESLLPKSIVWRKNKKGFEAPTNEWMKIIEKDLSKEISNSEILKKILKQNANIENLDQIQKWRLYNVAKWEKIYNIK